MVRGTAGRAWQQLNEGSHAGAIDTASLAWLVQHTAVHVRAPMDKKSSRNRGPRHGAHLPHRSLIKKGSRNRGLQQGAHLPQRSGTAASPAGRLPPPRWSCWTQSPGGGAAQNRQWRCLWRQAKVEQRVHITMRAVLPATPGTHAVAAKHARASRLITSSGGIERWSSGRTGTSSHTRPRAYSWRTALPFSSV